MAPRPGAPAAPIRRAFWASKRSLVAHAGDGRVGRPAAGLLRYLGPDCLCCIEHCAPSKPFGGARGTAASKAVAMSESARRQEPPDGFVNDTGHVPDQNFPSTSTKSLNGCMLFKQIVNGTSTCSLGAR